MNVLVLTGSARSGSFTRALGAQIADATAGTLGPDLTALPYFDQDLEAAPPAAVQQLRAQVAAADALVVVTPEYNGTISGLLGNAIDWLSRPYEAGPSVLKGKPTVAAAASPGPVGGVRALVSLRTVLGNAGVQLLDTTLTVGEVHDRLAAGDLELADVVAAVTTPVLQAA